jgi:hypothetical protein
MMMIKNVFSDIEPSISSGKHQTQRAEQYIEQGAGDSYTLAVVINVVEIQLE